MSTPLYLTKREFADHRGISPGYVTKLKEQGRLVMAPDGKRIDVAATEALLQRTADPSKAGVAERHQRERVERGVTDHLLPSSPPTDSGGECIDFQKAKARREHYLAILAENEARKSNGELVERKAVEDASFAAGRLLRDLLLGLPKQLSAELAAIGDPWELERRLTAGLRRVLEDAQRLSSADFENAINPQS